MSHAQLLTPLLLTLCLLGGPSFANAGTTVSGVVDVRLSVPRGCVIALEVHQRSHWGVVYFGEHPRLDPHWQGIDAEAPGLEALNIVCNPGTEYQLGVDGGLHGNAASRYLVAQTGDEEFTGRGAFRLPYQVFLDAARRQPWPSDQLVGFTVPSNGRLRIPLYGRIESLDIAPPVGFYTDELTLTLRW